MEGIKEKGRRGKLLGFFRMLWRISGLPRHFFLLIALILKWATLPVGLKKCV